jgi:hypothetical protein
VAAVRESAAGSGSPYIEDRQITEERQRQALIAAAENVPGVKAVHDRLCWIDAMSGVLTDQPSEEPVQAKAS